MMNSPSAVALGPSGPFDFLETLYRAGIPDCRAVFSDAMASENEGIRQGTVIIALGQEGDLPLDVLLVAAGDKDLTTRRLAVIAIGWSRNGRAIGALRRLLSDPERDVRIAVAMALEALGCNEDFTKYIGPPDMPEVGSSGPAGDSA